MIGESEMTSDKPNNSNPPATVDFMGQPAMNPNYNHYTERDNNDT